MSARFEGGEFGAGRYCRERARIRAGAYSNSGPSCEISVLTLAPRELFYPLPPDHCLGATHTGRRSPRRGQARQRVPQHARLGEIRGARRKAGGGKGRVEEPGEAQGLARGAWTPRERRHGERAGSPTYHTGAKRFAFSGFRQLAPGSRPVGSSRAELRSVAASCPLRGDLEARSGKRRRRGERGARHDPRRRCGCGLHGELEADEDLRRRGLPVGVLRPLQEPYWQVVRHGDLR